MKTPVLATTLICLLLSPAAKSAEVAPCKGSSPRRTLTVSAAGGTPFRDIQQALDAAQPGDLVLVKAGRYQGGNTFRRGGAPGACITLKGEKGAEITGGRKGIEIESKSYISVQGLTVHNIQGGDTPIGISVSGSSSHIELRDNVVHHVQDEKDAHGIAFYGTSSTPMSDLLIDGNEIYGCRLGSSETLVLNGNVTNFQVSRNKVHDNNNIGIDVIGYEHKGPDGQDFARNGVISENVVYKISSIDNREYHGERSADGIYVDGGRGIVIERNKVSDSDIAIEVASEHGGRTTQGITVRNNTASNSYQGNLMIGGYDANRGHATGIVVEGNTFSGSRDGEIIIQFYVNGVQIKGNTFRARPGVRNIYSRGQGNANIVVEGNSYAGGVPRDKSDLGSRDGTFTQIQDHQ